tara:strand:+ start:1301 stop:1606 length:306 start_codon:yes stop_codon:yes gene_type:complete
MINKIKKEIIKSIITSSPSGELGVKLDVWKEDNNIVGHIEIWDIDSGGQKDYATSSLQFNDDLELCEYDGNFPNGLPKYIFPILKKNGFNPDEIQSLEEED